MVINGEKIPTLAVFPAMMTVPDCLVLRSNKLGRGNGEAKMYIASKEEMYDFYGPKGFAANCIMLKKDLIAYMLAIKNEYMQPSQDYTGKDRFPILWNERMKEILDLEEVVQFTVYDQKQIAGPRGYVKSEDEGYKIIRKIALPLVSYIYVEKIGEKSKPLFYWKLFVDFDAIWEKQSQPLVFKYGKQETINEEQEKSEEITPESKRAAEIRQARDGQGKYREQLLQECRYCPFTMIADERLLIASHIKPWAASTDEEKTDPHNGYMLSPLYDKLFDRGFITFTKDKHVILSEFLSPLTWKQINLKNDAFIQMLPMDENRERYLEFHHQSVFKGSYDYSEDAVSENKNIPYNYEFEEELMMVAEEAGDYNFKYTV